MTLKGKPVPLFALVLAMAAVAIGVYGYLSSSFGLGVLAMFLLWWADNDRKQSREQRREEQLIAKFAPELSGMSSTDASKYILEAVDKFRERAAPASTQRFADLLAEQQSEWEKRGRPMPQWATLELLRKVETSADR
jgi:hypothetical protein